MRVVSQNKDFSCDFGRTVFWVQNAYIYAKVGSDNRVIGAYSSGDRAKEVFADMHNAFAPVAIVSTNLSKEQVAQFVGSKNALVKCIEMNELDTGITTYDNFVYYMPEREES